MVAVSSPLVTSSGRTHGRALLRGVEVRIVSVADLGRKAIRRNETIVVVLVQVLSEVIDVVLRQHFQTVHSNLECADGHLI